MRINGSLILGCWSNRKPSTVLTPGPHEIIRRCGERITVFCGCDTIALESFWLGFRGWVGGIVNVLPEAHVRLYELAVKQSDATVAREYFYRLLPVLAQIEEGGKYTQFVKAGCEIAGHPVGLPRQPLLPSDAEESEVLGDALGPWLGEAVPPVTAGPAWQSCAHQMRASSVGIAC